MIFSGQVSNWRGWDVISVKTLEAKFTIKMQSQIFCNEKCKAAWATYKLMFTKKSYTKEILNLMCFIWWVNWYWFNDDK